MKTAYKSGKITKENINKRGYNKFLELSNHVCVKINEDKISEDKNWDGLKGYLTNTDLSAFVSAPRFRPRSRPGCR